MNLTDRNPVGLRMARWVGMLAVYDMLKPQESATDVVRAFNCSAGGTMAYAVKKVLASPTARTNLAMLKKHLRAHIQGYSDECPPQRPSSS